MLKGIIFDMDGTLTLTNVLHALSYKKLFARFGVDLEVDRYFQEYIGKGAKEILATELKGQNVNFDDFMSEKKDIFRTLLDENANLLVPGVMPFIKYCLSHDIKITVASGAAKCNMDLILAKAGLIDFFDEYFSSVDEKNDKPAPDVYLKALEWLGETKESVLVFEDSAIGIQAAKAAELTVVGLKTTSEPRHLIEAGAEFLIDDYIELLETVEINPNCLNNILINKNKYDKGQ